MRSVFLLVFSREKKEWMLCLTKKCESLHGITWSTPSGCKDAGRQSCIGCIPPISPVMMNDESQKKRQRFFDTCLPTNKEKFEETHRTHRDQFPKGNFLAVFLVKVFFSEGSFFSKVGKPKGKALFSPQVSLKFSSSQKPQTDRQEFHLSHNHSHEFPQHARVASHPDVWFACRSELPTNH